MRSIQVRKSVFPCQKVSFSCFRVASRHTAIFILVLAYPKRGDKAFLTTKPSIERWIVCGPLTPYLIGLKHRLLD